MQTSLVRVWLPLSLFLLALSACGLLQPGQRLLHFEIEQDGKLAFVAVLALVVLVRAVHTLIWGRKVQSKGTPDAGD
jgi:hypothetical protein